MSEAITPPAVAVPAKPVVAYHGLGYVGLTGAVHFATSGHVDEVIGYDPDRSVVDAINKGAPKAGEFLGYLGAGTASYRPTLWATDDFADTLTATVHIVAVPSERNDRPFMQIVIDVVKRLIHSALPDTLIIIESTLTPGTVDEILSTTDEARIERGIRIAVAPRRDWFADPAKNLQTLERIVGGYDAASTARAIEVLSLVTEPSKILTTGYKEAELVKATENALLHLPIMLLHELAVRFPDVHVADVARLASTHWRFKSMGQLYLGAGSGGRCVPLGPQYLHEGGSNYFFSSTVIGAALNVERAMSDITVHAVLEHIDRKLSKGAPCSVLVLGIAYRPAFRDAGMSPGLRVARRCKPVRRVTVTIHDPMWTSDELNAMEEGISAANLDDVLSADAVVLTTAHTEYLELPLDAARWRGNQVILDAHGTWAAHKAAFEAMGSTYVQVGTPGWIPRTDV